MKYKIFYIFLIFVIFFSVNQTLATTHLWFWVNGDTANVLTQGDTLAWELDVDTPGNMVRTELYLDLDSSKTITAGDQLLDVFSLRDGSSGDGGPGDSSSVADGILYVFIGPFGFATQHYLMRVIDENESSITNWFQMLPHPSPPATISGRIYIEGSSPPASVFENIMIGTMGPNGIFTGLSNEHGLYTMNLPVADSTWEVSVFFSMSFPGYIHSDTTYRVHAVAGNTDSINFYFKMPQAWVYGNFIDQDGSNILIDTHIRLENRSTGTYSSGLASDGFYNLPAMIGIQNNDSTNYFELDFSGEILIPQYLNPDNEEFPVSFGDSIEQNIIVYESNAKIYGYITEDSLPPSQDYFLVAGSDTFGSTITFSDEVTGYFELNVREGTYYWMGIETDPEYGTPLPPGYIVQGGEWRIVNPGDTIYLNLIEAGNLLAGDIYFDPGDPIYFDNDRNRVNVWDSTYTVSYGARIGNNYHFEVPVQDGTYSLDLDLEDDDYLTMPSEYNNITVEQDTVDTLDFLLNYGHAYLTVKLVNPPPVPPWFYSYWISTTGEWPNVYSTSRELYNDSTFYFNICEGTWYLEAPFQVPNYSVEPEDTLLIVTENDSSFYIEFDYTDYTGIENKNDIPQAYYLHQNFPNPFNPETAIRYGLKKAGEVKLTIYNLLGQKVTTLVDKHQKAGNYEIKWTPENQASGIYFYNLESEEFNKSRKLLFLK